MTKLDHLNYLLISRILSAVLGGYLFTWGFTAVGIAGLVAVGVDFHEAETAALIMAFLVFPGVFLWAFACRRVAVVWTVLAGGGALMTLAARGIQQSILV
ncbi:iron uptake protein [Limnobacter parvus]|uniref:Iron uptake protein n=1 Tax=Limnobacter parvus TaxID=2939690 RepID=A0ABT1XKX2_9BURK|nr:iron uptake protein [Limnobacter parvus]MCR2747839.1 iron uptake protein [Limnobacter parvus]